MPDDDPPPLPQSLRDAAAGHDPLHLGHDVPTTGPLGTNGRAYLLRLYDSMHQVGRRALVTWAQALEQDPALRRERPRTGD